MFGTIRKHQGWLWWVIIVVIVLSFVVFFAPSNRYNDRTTRSSANHGTIDGETVTEAEWQDAWREAHLKYYFMHGGQWPDQDSSRNYDIDREAYQQLLLIRRLDAYHIDVDSKAVVQVADGLLKQFGRGKAISTEDLNRLIGRYATMEDFERFIRHDLGVRQLVSLVGASGVLVTPQEAQALYERENKSRVSQAVFFTASNYLASVVVTPDATVQYYSNHLADYRVPERRTVSYVEFGVSNLLAKAEKDLTNLTELVEANMQQIGSNFMRVAPTREEARVRVREGLIRQKALYDAGQQANEFASVLFDMKPESPQNLAALAKTKGLTAKVTAPFDDRFGPEELSVGPDFVQAAFALTPKETPFGGPLRGQDGVYVIAFDKMLPSEIQPFDKIRDRVLADYKNNQAAMLARQAGVKFAQAATNAVAQGKSFASVADEFKLKPVFVSPISIASTNEFPEVEQFISVNGSNDRRFPGYKQVVFSTPVGQASGFFPMPEGGLVVYVSRENPVDAARMQAELPGFIQGVRQQRTQDAFYDWFGKQVERQPDKNVRDILMGRRQQAGGMASPES